MICGAAAPGVTQAAGLRLTAVGCSFFCFFLVPLYVFTWIDMVLYGVISFESVPYGLVCLCLVVFGFVCFCAVGLYEAHLNLTSKPLSYKAHDTPDITTTKSPNLFQMNNMSLPRPTMKQAKQTQMFNL